MKKLGKYGVPPTQEQVDYFETIICTRWRFGWIYSTTIRAERGNNPHENLIALAEKWDSRTFRDACEDIRQGKEPIAELEGEE